MRDKGSLSSFILHPSSFIPDQAAWLAEFVRKHGRRPRILHIGNIANNAYSNAKLLNRAGLDCDVICYDYYHIMGCPEWEDADFEGTVADQFHPDWTRVDLRGFQRPQWFAQGPIGLCLRYLIARREQCSDEADRLWQRLQQENGTRRRTALAVAARLLGPRSAGLRRTVASAWRTVLPAGLRLVGMARRVLSLYNPFLPCDLLAVALIALAFFPQFDRVLTALHRNGLTTAGLLAVLACAWIALRVVRKFCWRFLPEPLRVRNEPSCDAVDPWMDDVIAQFNAAFPDRADRLTKADLSPYCALRPLWQRLFAHYDLVQAYATDPILPLLAGKRPYIGFEHGTLRTFTLGPTPLCRTTALGYRLADHVFITNGDCLEYARKIGVTRMSPMLHPVDDKAVLAAPRERRKVHEDRQARYIFLCTLRHDWEIKGTDKYIRALPAVRERIGDDFRVIMTQWGCQVEDSKALAESLGVSSFIHWTEPFSRRRLVRLLKSVDVLLDQIALPHFGATAPEGIAAGVPVIMSYDPASTRWIVAEAAPILTAWTEEEIAAQIALAIQPAWLEDYRRRARQWIADCHNTEIIVRTHLEVYRGLLEGDRRMGFSPSTANLDGLKPILQQTMR